MGDGCHLRLNMNETPIEHKYCEGKVKRTLKREWNEHEIVRRGTEINKYLELFVIYVGKKEKK